jgi:hypothetical protein
MEGYGLERIAYDLDLPVWKVFDRAKKLGLELARRAGVRIELEKEKQGRRAVLASRGVPSDTHH